MKKYLFFLFIGILVFPSYVHADGPYLNIPPTDAFDKVATSNDTIHAKNFIAQLNLVGKNGVTITGSNASKTVYISGSGTGNGTGGNFTCNTGSNCVNINDTQHIYSRKYFEPGLNIGDWTVNPYDTINNGLKFQINNTFISNNDISMVPANGSNDFILQILPFSNLTKAVFNFLDLQSSHFGQYFITSSTENTNGLLELSIQKVNSANTTKNNSTNLQLLADRPAIRLSANIMSIPSHTVLIENATDPVSQQDVMTKHYFENNVGALGSLTLGPCVSGNILQVNYSLSPNWNCVNQTNGATGPTGPTGANGSPGSNGATGPTGPAGGNFTCNTSHNCVNLNDSQVITNIKNFSNGMIIDPYFIKYNPIDGILHIQDNNSFATNLGIMPKNGTNTGAFNDIFGDPQQNNFLELHSAIAGIWPSSIRAIRNDSTDLNIETANSRAMITLSGSSNIISFLSAPLGGGNALLQNASDPIDPQDVATKHYVDNHTTTTRIDSQDCSSYTSAFSVEWLLDTFNNSTHQFTCNTAIQKINNDPTKSQFITGTSGNVTISDDFSGGHQINTGNNLAYLNKFNNFTNKNDFGGNGNNLDIFDDSGIIIRNPAHTFATTLTNPAITANRTLNLPLITGTDTLATTGLVQIWTANQDLGGATDNKDIFDDVGIIIRNPAHTFATTITSPAITANRTLTLPLTSGTIALTNQMSTHTVDISNAAYSTILNNDTVDAAITATSKPSLPQFVETISSGNIPSDTTDVQDYTVIFTVGGKNTNATTAKTISLIPTRNGVEVDTTRSVSVPSGNFWESGEYMSGAALASGDKIGLKLWCSSAPCTNGGGLDYRYGTIYIVPRQFLGSNSAIYELFPGSTQLTLSGTITGVTFSTAILGGLGVNNAGTIVDNTLGTPAAGWTTQNIALKGQELSELGSTAGVITRATQDIGFTPSAQAASNLMSVQFTKFVRVNVWP